MRLHGLLPDRQCGGSYMPRSTAQGVRELELCFDDVSIEDAEKAGYANTAGYINTEG